jgi:type II secretory pathway pseudopilin PulG
MTSFPSILAAGEGIGELLQLILVLGAAAAIALMKWVGNKVQQRQAEQQAAEQARRLREDLGAGRAAQAPPAPIQSLQSPGQPRRNPYRPIPARQPIGTQPVMPQGSPQQAQQRRRRKPPAQPAELVVLEPVSEHRLVEAEVAMPSAVHHDFYAYPGRPGALGHEAAQAAPAAAVNLSDPDTLRQAVIYRELLSPPKALRHESEPWEL